MAVPTWSQFTFLTANQQTVAAAFETIGNAVALWRSGKGPQPDISSVTQSQAKAADAILRDANVRIGAAQIGIKYVEEANRTAALAAYEAANP